MAKTERFIAVSVDDVLAHAGDDPRVRADDAKRDVIPVPLRCPRCEGTGNELLFMYRCCMVCSGSGVLRDA